METQPSVKTIKTKKTQKKTNQDQPQTVKSPRKTQRRKKEPIPESTQEPIPNTAPEPVQEPVPNTSPKPISNTVQESAPGSTQESSPELPENSGRHESSGEFLRQNTDNDVGIGRILPKSRNVPENVLYPNIDDQDFQYKIAQKKEFADTRYDGRILDIEEESEKRCNAPFELMPHQLFVKNFMSMQTPYNSLLLYNGLGSGKSLTAIGVSEEMRTYMKQVGVHKRIVVLASPNVVNNFRLQLFDESKLRLENGIWTINSSIAQAILDEINPTHLKDMSKSRILANVQALIKTYYDFKGYVKFSNEISNALKPFPEGDPRRIRKIQSMFNNHLFVIDEVHNIRLTRDNDDLTTANYLYMIAKYAKNVRFVLLSATPMYNSYKEIIWLTNLMNVNDRRTEITNEQIFTKTGEFRTPVSSNELVGEALLRKKLMGYVSYVRGENPYTFPFRIYQSNLPKPSGNEPPIYPPLFMSKIGDIQKRVYQMALKQIQQRRTTVQSKPSASASGFPAVDASTPTSEMDVGSTNMNVATHILKDDVEVQKNMMTYLETLDNVGYEQLRVPIQTLNIVYQDIPAEKMDTQQNMDVATHILKDDSAKLGVQRNMDFFVGKLGLEQVVQITPEKRYKYQSNHSHFFEKQKLRPYSQKISTILDHIHGSTGIVMIYSEFIYGGVIPMALALEESGFARASRSQGKPSTSLFLEPPTPPIPGMYYTLITGDKDYSPNNVEDLAKINHPDNRNGEYVKVVIISRAGAEGLDFKNIRQVHIMEPWYNMSRIEQIIGRGVRNLSHCNLPIKERNVEIYMHASEMEEGISAADMYLYQLSFKKAIQIGRVSRVLKETSVDCVLNRGQANFTVEKMNQSLRIHTSTSEGDIDYQVGDQSYTAICDYSDKCDLQCQSNVPEETLEKTLGTNQFTYSTTFLKANQGRIIEIVRSLFSKQIYYPVDVLVQEIQKERNYPIEQIYYSLTYLIQNKNEYLLDKYGRLGHLINRGDIYAFQPIEITDERISVFDRTFPVEYKIPKIHITLSPTFAPVVGNEGTLPPKQTVQEEATIPTVPTFPTFPTFPTVPEEVETPMSYETILAQIQTDIETIETVSSKARSKTNKQSWDDYMHAGDLFSTLRDIFGMDLSTIQKYMIHHAIDSMSMSMKLILLNHFLVQSSGDSVVETEVYKYLNTCIHREEKSGREYLVLANEKNQVEIFKKSGEGNTWNAAQYTDIQMVQRTIIEPFRVSMTPLKEHTGKVLGIYLYEMTKERMTQAPIFKIKDFTKKTTSRNAKGENMKKAGKIREVELLKLALADIYPENELVQKENFSVSKYNQGNLNILLELVLRHGGQKTEGIQPIGQKTEGIMSDKKRMSMMSPETYAMLSILF